MSNNKQKRKLSAANNAIIFSLISIVLGLVVGAIALLIAGFNPQEVQKMSNNKQKRKLSAANNAIIFSLISIVLGLVVGAIALLIAGFNPIEAYSAMITGVFGKPKFIAWTIIRSTPLILTGLSIAFAYKTGLFNIGYINRSFYSICI